MVTRQQKRKNRLQFAFILYRGNHDQVPPGVGSDGTGRRNRWFHLALLKRSVEPGMTTGDLNRIAEKNIRSQARCPLSSDTRGFPPPSAPR